MAVYDSKYNGAELDDALDDALSHIQDNTIHVTSTEKQTWNNKQKTIEGGSGITVTTGANTDTVSINLPIFKGGGDFSIRESFGTMAEGNSSHAEGQGTTASGSYSHAEGFMTTTSNRSEHASGQFNISHKNSTTFGDSGNTLFSVGNGKNLMARHNAFEIRQNGDIYITKDGQEVKLQDNLGSKLDQYVCDVEEDGLYFVDSAGYIGAAIDNGGLHAINLPTFNNY